MKQIRLKDLAEETGFSIKTISRAINNHPDINKQTKETIMKVVKKYDYVPNPIASNLRTNKTNTIGFIVPDFINEFYGAVGIAIETYFRERNFSVLICFSGNSHDGEIKALKLLQSKRVDGIILASVGTTDATIQETIKKMDVPVIAIDNEFKDIRLTTVLHDNIHGAELLTQHLINHGHQRIACIAGLQHQTSGKERLKGFLKAMNKNNIKVPESNILYGKWTPEGGTYSMNKIIQLPEAERPTAIFASNSLMAMGCYKALIKVGLLIPKDYAIVSFDNLSFIEALEPPITTLSSAEQEIGVRASELLYNKMKEEGEPQPIRVTVPGVILRRRSCGCA